MSNLSGPMRYALENSFVTETGLYGFTSDVRTQTITGLIKRGLVFRDDYDNTPYLNKTGEAVRAELIAPDQGDVNPVPTTDDVTRMMGNPVEWVESTLAARDERIAEYLASEDDPTYLDRNYTPGDMTDDQYRSLTTETPSQNAADGTDTTPEGEDTREAVPGLEKLLDTPHVVPNRKDKRNRRRIIRAFNRLFARKRDEQTKKRTDAAKAARKRGRKVAA